MATRTILHLGTGGAGTTTVAAATARRLAAQGARTLLLGIGPGDGPHAVLGVAVQPGITPVGERLSAGQARASAGLAQPDRWLGALLARRGLGAIAPAQLQLPPGADELAGMLELARCVTSGDYDAIVVDAGPWPHALRALTLPDVAGWWLERLLPQRSSQVAAGLPLARVLPDAGAVDDLQRALRGLIALGDVLRDRELTSARVVTIAETLPLAAAQRAWTALALHGIHADGLVANRLQDHEASRAGDAVAAFAPAQVFQARLMVDEPSGDAGLDALADELFGKRDPAAVGDGPAGQELVLGAREAELCLALPFAEREDVDVKHAGLDLLVRAGDQRRTIALPPVLADYRPAGAQLEAGVLRVLFDRRADTPTATTDD